MDYFQDLLQSYQRIKNRTFRVSQIVEQGGQGEVLAQSYISQAQSNKDAAEYKVPVAEFPVTFVWVVRDPTAKTRGQVVWDGFPWSKNRAQQVSGGGFAKANFNDFARLLGGGEQATEKESESGKTEQGKTEQLAGAAEDPSLVQPIVDPSTQKYTNALAAIATKARSLVDGNFFQSVFDLPKNSFFPWLSGKTKIEDYISGTETGPGKFVTLQKKLDESITGEETPLTDSQKAEIAESFNKFLEISEKVKTGTASLDDIKWVKDHIETGASYSDKRTMRVKSSESDLVVTFKWSKGVGIQKDTQVWKHMIDSYDKAATQWASDNNVPVSDVLISRKSLKEMAVGSGQMNAIRGFFAEDFIPVGLMLQKANSLESMDPRRAKEYRLEAAKMLQEQINKNGDALLKAFNAYSDFVGDGVAVDDDVLSELNDLKDVLKTFRSTLSEAQLGSMDDIQKKKFVDVLTMKVAKSLVELDGQFALKLDADYAVTTGRVTRNGTKTDLAFVFKNEAAARLGLQRAGLSDQQINKVLLSGENAKTLYAGSDIEKFVKKSGPEAVVVPIGVKTYLADAGVTLGTTSVRAGLEGLIGETADPRFNTENNKIIRNELKRKYGKDYAKHLENIKELQKLTNEFQRLKWSGNGEIPKQTLRQLKAVVAKESQEEWSDLSQRIDNYSTDPSSDSELRYDVNKYLDSYRDKLLMNRIKKGIVDGDRSWQATLEGFLRTTGQAAEQNQLTVTRYLSSKSSYIMDHNESVLELMDGLENGSLKLDKSGKGFKFIVNCKGRRICDADHFASLNLSGGKFSLESTLYSVKRHQGKIKTKEAITASTKLILNFLKGQQKLLEDLLSKYQ